MHWSQARVDEETGFTQPLLVSPESVIPQVSKFRNSSHIYFEIFAMGTR